MVRSMRGAKARATRLRTSCLHGATVSKGKGREWSGREAASASTVSERGLLAQRSLSLSCRRRRQDASFVSVSALPANVGSGDEVLQLAQSSLVSISAFEGVLSKVGFGSLFATTGVYWSKAAFGNLKEHGALEKGTMASANVAMLILLCLRWIDAGHFPLSNLYESLLFLSWGISAVHFYLAYRIPESGVAGTLTSPTALAVLGFATLILPPELQKATALVPALKSNWLFMHVSVMMMSYATLLVGSLMSFGFLLIDTFTSTTSPDGKEGGRESGSNATSMDGVMTTLMGLLPFMGNSDSSFAPASASTAASVDMARESNQSRNNRPEELEILERNVNVSSLSAEEGQGEGEGKRDLLEMCDDLAYRSIGLGFAFLTIGIISGAVWANEAWGSYWSWDPKETWALITWLFYAIYLHGRIYKDWSPKKTAAVSASGFVVVWICYVGVNLFGVGLHSYGFFK